MTRKEYDDAMAEAQGDLDDMVGVCLMYIKELEAEVAELRNDLAFLIPWFKSLSPFLQGFYSNDYVKEFYEYKKRKAAVKAERGKG